MDGERWLTALDWELRRHGIGPDNARHVVAEAAAHLRDSGQDAMLVFGSPARYAAAVAESIGVPGDAAGNAGVPGRVAGPPGPVAGHVAPTGHPAAHREVSPGPVRLAVDGVGKRYRRREVLRDVHLRVHAGQIAAVVGANGCGKSTFLRICAGLESPDSGQVTVSGRIGYCPQQGGTYDFLRAEEHFVLVGAGAGLSREQARAAGRSEARRLGWATGHSGAGDGDGDGDTLARHLSGGTRQKLNLAMSTMTRPDVLLLDEPYQGFDQGTYVNFWERLWRLRDAGCAVVVVTHLLTELDRVDLVLDLTPTGTIAPTGKAVRDR